MKTTEWFCALESINVIATKTFSLAEAEASLGPIGRHLVIPMTGSKAGDPHPLNKLLQGGRWWWNASDVNKMQALCEKTSIPGKIISYIHMTELLTFFGIGQQSFIHRHACLL